MLVCYSKVFLQNTIGVLGISAAEFNPHVLAALMWTLGLVALYGLYQDRRIHHKTCPLVLGVAGVVTIILALYAHYKEYIEMFGCILLIVAALLLNQNARLQQLKHALELQAGEA